MNTEPNRRARRRMWTAEQDAAMERLAAAHARLKADTANPEARKQVHLAVDAAREVGVGWTRIGETLGIAGGNAYQKYRKKLPPKECCGQSAE